jgi:hypothetical protein
MARTIVKLRQARRATAQIDLQRLGTNLDPERWYFGMLWILGESLDLQEAMVESWNSNPHLSAFARWSTAIETVILPRFSKELSAGQSTTDKGIDLVVPAEGLVIFVDEIDIVRGLPFSADEFFHGIRDLYNRRSTNKIFNRITFCLLGVAKPSELVKDARVTPFNVGRRIDLADFTAKEAISLSMLLVASGVAPDVEAADGLMERVIYWTNGHPYLTQRVCAALEREGGSKTKADVDRIVSDLFFQDVARRTLELPPDGMEKQAYLFVLSERLERLFRRGSLPDDDDDPILKTLRLTGLTRESARSVKVRNRIYERVFSLNWLSANVPELEIRRQQRALRKRWLTRVTAIGAAALCFAGLAIGFGLDVRDQKALADQRLTEAQELEKKFQVKLEEVEKLSAQLSEREKALRSKEDELDKVAKAASGSFPMAIAPASLPVPISLSNESPSPTALPGGPYEFTHSRYLVDSDLSKLKPVDIDIMRNAIYARYQIAFRRDRWRKYFSKNLPGYKPLRSGPQAERMLNKFEKFNVGFIGNFREPPSSDRTTPVEGPPTDQEPPSAAGSPKVRDAVAGEVLVEICADSGLRPNSTCPKTIKRPFKRGGVPKGYCKITHKPKPL